MTRKEIKVPEKKESKQPEKKEEKKKEVDLQKFVKPGMSLDDVKKLKDCFDIFDYDKGGSVSPSQLKNAIIALGLQNQAQKILGLVRSYTQDTGSEQLDFENFMNLFGFNSDLKSQSNLQSLFEHFDKDGKNFIAFEDFKVNKYNQRICQMLGERYSDNEIGQMIQHADKNKDGVIDFQQFVAVVTKQYPQV